MKLPQQLSLFNAQGGVPFAGGFLPNYPPFKEGVSYTKRVPNCQKCGQHGRKSRLKGHKRVCPFKDCTCAKCQVVSERQKLMADQIKIRRRQRKDTLMNMTRDKLTATLNAAAAVANIGPLPYLNSLNNLSMIYKQLAQGQPADAANSATQSPTATTMPQQLPDGSASPLTASPAASGSNADLCKSEENLSESTPQLISTPPSAAQSTLGLHEICALSPQMNPRAHSFDLGLLSNPVASYLNQQPAMPTPLTVPTSLGLSVAPTFLSAINVPATTTTISAASQPSSPTALGLEMSPPQSAGLVAPMPISAVAAPPATSLSGDNLLNLVQFLYGQQPAAPQPQFIPQPLPPPPAPAVSASAAASINQLQQLLAAAALLQQHQIQSPVDEKEPMVAVSQQQAQPNKTNGFIDVCSV